MNGYKCFENPIISNIATANGSKICGFFKSVKN
nr:MAG TPA: hypothetical protein [Caudoviricetes sp.]